MFWLYTFDIASGCAWNPKAVKSIGTKIQHMIVKYCIFWQERYTFYYNIIITNWSEKPTTLVVGCKRPY
jgi:uncharacterized protein affecting Mg2+/Co2+ transport